MLRSIIVVIGLGITFWSVAQNNTTLITDVRIIDGTGIPAYSGSVRIQGTRIVAVGNLQPLSGETIVRGENQFLCPGFIDAHSHHFSSLKEFPGAAATNNQGITTIVIGQDGSSYPIDTLRNWMSRNKVAVNVASYTGHTSLREQVMGETQLLRSATPKEISAMQHILYEEMRKGSLGLSTGLEYEPAFFSSKEEVFLLASTAAAMQGRYISHIRSEDVTLSDALNEIIEIGQKTGMPVQISHIKIAQRSQWNTSAAILQQLQQARQEGVQITADIYPYTFWNSTLKVLFPSRNYTSLADATLAVTQLCDPEGSIMVHFAPMPAYEGKSLSQIAQLRKETPAQTLINLIALANTFRKENPHFNGSVETIMGKSMTENDVRNFIAWPFSVICSDGGNGGHPRGYGAFTRVLHQYVLKQALLPVETAIYKMTGLTAQHLGLQKRGVIKPGYYADLVLFNLQKIKDNASIQNGKALSDGIEKVWIGGKITWQQQQLTGNLPGVFITKE
ncbi:MAG: D-aminoacylase [Chitinophagia bacterium]|nr:D-aminoacylase [Chitinophagia bacterium]